MPDASLHESAGDFSPAFREAVCSVGTCRAVLVRRGCWLAGFSGRTSEGVCGGGRGKRGGRERDEGGAGVWGWWRRRMAATIGVNEDIGVLSMRFLVPARRRRGLAIITSATSDGELRLLC